MSRVVLLSVFLEDKSFIYVCISGNSECVKLLISMGACLEAYDLYYGTPLHVACANEHTDCVRELLNAGEGLHSRMNQTQSTTQCKLPYSQRANCRPAGGADENTFLAPLWNFILCFLPRSRKRMVGTVVGHAQLWEHENEATGFSS